MIIAVNTICLPGTLIIIVFLALHSNSVEYPTFIGHRGNWASKGSSGFAKAWKLVKGKARTYWVQPVFLLLYTRFPLEGQGKKAERPLGHKSVKGT